MDQEDRQPQMIPGMCSKGPPSYRIGESPTESRLTLQQVKEAVEETGTLHCVHGGTKREILSGGGILCKAELLYSENSEERTDWDYIHQVAANTTQNNKDLWDRYIDPETGNVLVEENQDESVWGIGFFLFPGKNGTVDPMSPVEISRIAEEILEERSAERDFSDKEALAAAMELVRAAIAINQSEIHDETWWLEDTDDPEWEAEYTVRGRATETLDIAYNYSRIVMAGINLDQHPEYHSYQPFYEMGWKPPSHQEMADYIIQALREG